MRSLWHLSRHLTARADDNHAAPSQESRRKDTSLHHAPAIQARVRFLAYHRIKPHVPPLVRAPVNSFEFHRCRRTPQVESHLTMAVPPESSALAVSNWHQGLRSLWHLSRHLTARADDNHAAPSQESRRKDTSLHHAPAIPARVRFLAYHRIKPHVPPLVRAPVNSFEFHRCRRTPQVGY